MTSGSTSNSSSRLQSKRAGLHPADARSKIQHLPTGETTERVRITVPKRGEKDFEPLAETTNLQEMMLQKSREALFNAMVGVRGGNR